MNTWAYLVITFSFTVIAPLVGAWILAVCKLICPTPDRATDVAHDNTAVSNADVGPTVATVSDAMENHDTDNHLRNGDNLNILNGAVVTLNGDNLNNLNEAVVTLNGGNLNNFNEAVVTRNGEQIGQVVVNIEDHDHEESGV